MRQYLVKLAYDATRFSLYRPDGSILSGYGTLNKDYGHHVAKIGLDDPDAKVTIVDYRTAKPHYDAVITHSVRSPMVNLTIEKDEQDYPTSSLSYVTLDTYLRLLKEAVPSVTITTLTAEEAANYPCDRCPTCNSPTYEWGGTRHINTDNVRLDNDNGKACKDVH